MKDRKISGKREADSPSTGAAAWNARYVHGHTPWVLGTVSPPLVQAVRERRLRPGTVAIPGAGIGHEALYLVRLGYQVTAFDFAPAACRALEHMTVETNVPVTVIYGDVFSLEDRFTGAFDYVFEQTFFCAIPRNRRPDYVDIAQRLLKPRGRLVGVFFDIGGDEDSPPFGTDADELRRLFAPQFEILTLEPCRWSHHRRLGHELWAEFRKVG